MCKIDEVLAELENKCDFLLEKIGEIDLKDLEQHLEGCKDCQEELASMYQSYRGYYISGNPTTGPSDALFIWHKIPSNLPKENFLKYWDLALRENEELREAYWADLIRRGQSVAMFYHIRKLLIWQNRLIGWLVNPLRLQCPIENSLSALVKKYREFDKFLGSHGFNLLMDLEEVSGHWKSMVEELLSKK